ncbi:hypothetical protein KPL70_021375 [Citrus sinensis]|nr:hypothetical protein KPL70_021375 [Citrus sinensis]
MAIFYGMLLDLEIDPNCPCWDDWEEDDLISKKKPKPKWNLHHPCKHFQPQPRDDPPPPLSNPLPIYKQELKWIAKHYKSEVLSPVQHNTPIIQSPTCMMFASTSKYYSTNFPPLDTQFDTHKKVVSKPFIPSAITSTSHFEEPRSFQAVLNWQTQNARAQNDTLMDIHKQVDRISLRTDHIESKEREIRHLKAELDQIDYERQRPILFTKSPLIPTISLTYHPFTHMLTPMKPYDPSKLFGMTHTIFKTHNLQPQPRPKPKATPWPVKIHPPVTSTTEQQSPRYTPAPSQPHPTQAKDKEPMHQYSSQQFEPIIPSESASTESESTPPATDENTSVTQSKIESSVSTSDSEKAYADITKLLMAQPEETAPAQPESYFEIPSDVDEPAESSTTNQQPPPNTQPSHKPSNGPCLGQYRQLQFVQLPNVSNALAVLHEQFIGDPSVVFEAARRDYLNMKCCSLNSKDFDFHYKRMSILFYKLNGFNDSTLKHVFLASLPEELQPNIQRQFTAHNLNIDNISLGKIFQIAKGCLEKLCEHKQSFKELMKDKEPFRSACHYAKNCPNKKEKSSRLIKHLQMITEYSPEQEEVEFYFSEQEEPTDETVFALENASDESDGDEFQNIFHQQSLSLDTTIPIPSIKLQILPSKFQRPISVIALIDIGAQRSMFPDLLPTQYWNQHTEHFRAADGQMFSTKLITNKPIGTHRQLLNQFFDIIQTYGIMLSATKSTIAIDNIEFLGMIIKDSHYQLGKHIAQELLSALLKKKPPAWNDNHTLVVITLKKIAQDPPPLKLITDGKPILQTDASDESWGAILLEDINGKESFIAYASGHFSDTQQHYHSVYKEILVVKNGIKKFEYHLIGYHFLIRMDSSAFPNVLNLKGKIIPEKMLLRLKDWFSKYDFSVEHIKGTQDLIPDMLSRLARPIPPLHCISTGYHFPIIFMATSLPNQALTQKTFPLRKTFSTVIDIQEFAKKFVFRFFMKAYMLPDSFPFSTFHPENLFLTSLNIDPSRDVTEDELWYIWCLTVLYTTELILPIRSTLNHFMNPDKSTSLTWTLLEWFSPLPWWRKKLQQLSTVYNLSPIGEDVCNPRVSESHEQLSRAR